MRHKPTAAERRLDRELLRRCAVFEARLGELRHRQSTGEAELGQTLERFEAAAAALIDRAPRTPAGIAAKASALRSYLLHSFEPREDLTLAWDLAHDVAEVIGGARKLRRWSDRIPRPVPGQRCWEW
jgi:hypothetical protein